MNVIKKAFLIVFIFVSSVLISTMLAGEIVFRENLQQPKANTNNNNNLISAKRSGFNQKSLPELCKWYCNEVSYKYKQDLWDNLHYHDEGCQAFVRLIAVCPADIQNLIISHLFDNDTQATKSFFKRPLMRVLEDDLMQ